MDTARIPSLEERKEWCLNNLVGKYHVNDFTVDVIEDKIVVNGDIVISDDFVELPDEAMIDIVKGDVYVSNTLEFRKGKLKSLRNMPRMVTGHFVCNGNPEVTTLEGGPEQVGGSYVANHCSLKDLKGCPKVVGVLKVFSNKLENIDDIVMSEFCAIDIEFNETLDKQTPLVQKLYHNRKIIEN